MDVDKSPVDQATAADTTKPGGQIRARDGQEVAAAIDGAESSPEKKRPDRRATPTKMKVTMASSRSVATRASTTAQCDRHPKPPLPHHTFPPTALPPANSFIYHPPFPPPRRSGGDASGNGLARRRHRRAVGEAP
jgi:hypothetical protein